MVKPTTPQIEGVVPERKKRRKPQQKPTRYDVFDPAIINDHAFEPRGEWYTLCKHCSLAMAAHAKTTVDPRDHIGYVGDDDPED